MESRLWGAVSACVFILVATSTGTVDDCVSGMKSVGSMNFSEKSLRAACRKHFTD